MLEAGRSSSYFQLPSPGKSSLVIQFVEDHFVDCYYPTIESTFTKTISHNNVEYECDIIDTAGQVCMLASVDQSPGRRPS